MHIHHLHDLSTVHYDVSTHDQYPAHHHEWSGNHFDTVNDRIADNYPGDIDVIYGADDHNVTTGDDHNHPGYDIHFSGGWATTSTTHLHRH